MQEREGLYIISVAARLLEMHQQTLRKYERQGFIRPQRTGGGLRLYSVEDVEQLRQIKYLVERWGLNLDGVKDALQLSRGLIRLHGALAPGLSAEEADRLRGEVVHLLRLLGLDVVRPAEPAPTDRAPRPRPGR